MFICRLGILVSILTGKGGGTHGGEGRETKKTVAGEEGVHSVCRFLFVCFHLDHKSFILS